MALGQETRTHFIDPWCEVQDGKLVRYIVHGDQRIARLSDNTGTSASAFSSESISGPKGQQSLLALLMVPFLLLFAQFGGRVRRSSPLVFASIALLLVIVACNHDSSPDGGADRGSIQTLSEEDILLFDDRIGSLAERTTSTGKASGSFAVFPFGLTRYDSAVETRKFANAPRDESVGLDNMGARYFSPELGVWTSPDPVLIDSPAQLVSGDFAAANPYAYANLTPAMARDDDGHFWHIVIGAGVGAVIGGGLEAYQQYSDSGGHITSWGRIAGHAAVGAVAGGITAAAGPQAGVGTVVALGAVSGAVQGVGGRVVDNGWSGRGTFSQAAGDAAVGAVSAGVLHGGAKLVARAAPKVKAALGRALCTCGGSCFASGTPVQTARGEVPIEEILVGDLVLSRDEETGEMAWKAVTQVFVNEDKIVFDLWVIDGTGESRRLETSVEHPFWVEGRGWQAAEDLVIGDEIGSSDDRELWVVGKDAPRTQAVTYNLEVEGFHTFFVGEDGVWVHNKGPCDVAAKGAVHGNSKASLKPNHRYEIVENASGDVAKTGISGQPLNANGTSPRANPQVAKLNQTEGAGTYSARVVETNLPGRSVALQSEQAATNQLNASGNSLRLQQRPKPQ